MPIICSRWPDAVIPLTLSQQRTGNRSNYMAWGLLQLPGCAEQYAVYATESYYRGASTLLRRFGYRLDGFVALSADGPGELVTRTLVFQGTGLEVNFVTAAGGSIKIELQTPAGEPLPGLSANDCQPLHGDSVAQQVRWLEPGCLRDLSGRTVRLRFMLEDAEVYSFRFDQF